MTRFFTQLFQKLLIQALEKIKYFLHLRLLFLSLNNSHYGQKPVSNFSDYASRRISRALFSHLMFIDESLYFRERPSLKKEVLLSIFHKITFLKLTFDNKRKYYLELLNRKYIPSLLSSYSCLMFSHNLSSEITYIWHFYFNY